MEPTPDLARFELIQMIRHNEYEKTIALWGHFGDPCKNAVIILKGTLPKQLNLKDLSRLKLYNHNDPYYYLTASMPSDYRLEIVYPATKEKHYHKYRDKIHTLKRQGPKEYAKRDLEKQLKYVSWMTEIIEGRKQVDRVIYRKDDPVQGFILLKDSDWKDDDKSTLHILGVTLDKNLHSLRDLGARHIGLLKSMQAAAKQIIGDKYKLESYREIFHYPPTFWHLHVHFLSLEVGGRSTMIERCHELNQVIYNLELCDGYYRDGTFTVLSEDHTTEPE